MADDEAVVASAAVVERRQPGVDRKAAARDSALDEALYTLPDYVG